MATKEDRPEIEAILGFIMQAEELADGKHQKACVSEVAQEFGDLMHYVETIERQRDNIQQSYASLMNKQRTDVSIIPTRDGKYF